LEWEAPRVVVGINRISLVWTDGAARLPCDFRRYDKPFGGLDKNRQFRNMLAAAKERGFLPAVVAFDGWYAGWENRKAVRRPGEHWFTRFKGNRLVNPDDTGNVPLSTLTLPPEGREVPLKGYGFVRLLRTVAPDSEVEDGATSDLSMTEGERREWARQAFGIEVYHRGIKQGCGIEKCQAQLAAAQRGHLPLALRAFVRLEAHWLQTGVGWSAAKTAIIRTALRTYLAQPRYTLATDPTA